MTKKMIALITACIMLVTFSPVVAADNVSAPPTIEEILSDFHQKAFEAQMTAEADAPSTYSRGSSVGSKTLEQETVDTLNAAGYTAYNVTGDNYDSLESTLKTDFSAMGLSKNSSYIVVISGEDSSNSNNPNSRLGNIPEYDLIDPGGGGPPSFEHTYNGKTYSMRYVTVTAAEDSNLDIPFSYTIKHSEHSEVWDELLEASLYYAADAFLDNGILGTIISLLTNTTNDSNLHLLESGQVTVIGDTLWTLRYLQVFDKDTNTWVNGQSSEYATSSTFCAGYLYNSETNTSERFVGEETVFTVYSPYYYSATQQKNDAVLGYLAYTGGYGSIVRDITDDISFYLIDESEHLVGNGNGTFLFAIPHWFYS